MATKPFTLVQRLRLPRDQFGQPPDPESMEAAAEIETLQAELREAHRLIHRCATDLYTYEQKTALCRAYIAQIKIESET